MKKRGFFKTIRRFFRAFFSIVSAISMSALILIGGFLAYYFISMKIYESRGENYQPFISLYTIISPSMEPNIKVYDVIIDKRVSDVSDIKKGDVITFISSSTQSEGLTVTHRVAGVVINPDGVAFKTKGDNNVKEDEGLVYAKQIIGKVIIKIPQLGKIQMLLATKTGWFVVVLLPALGVIIYDVIKLCKLIILKDQITLEREKRKKEQQIANEIYRKRKEEELLRKQELEKRLGL